MGIVETCHTHKFYRHLFFWIIYFFPFETSATASCGYTGINIIKGFWTLESITGEWNSYHRNFLWNFPGTGTLTPGTTSSSLSSQGPIKGVKGGRENTWKCLKFEINSCGQILSFSVFVGSLCLPFRFFKHVTRPESWTARDQKLTKSRSFSRPIIETCFDNHRTEFPVYSGVFHSPFHSFVPFRHWLVSNFDQTKAVFPTASSSRKVSGSRRSRSGRLVSSVTMLANTNSNSAGIQSVGMTWPEIFWFTEHFSLQLLCGVSSWRLGELYLRFLIDWFLTIFAKPKAQLQSPHQRSAQRVGEFLNFLIFKIQMLPVGGVHVHGWHYFLSWNEDIQTPKLRCLTVDVASVVWDLFLLDGEAR